MSYVNYSHVKHYRLAKKWAEGLTKANAAAWMLVGKPTDRTVLQSRTWIEGVGVWSDWEDEETVDLREDDPS